MILSEVLYKRLSSIFSKAGGYQLSPAQMETLQNECTLFAKELKEVIQESAQMRALEVCKLLNDATKLGFKSVSAEIELLKERLPSCESHSSAARLGNSSTDRE